jgi:hypothetical protein
VHGGNHPEAITHPRDEDTTMTGFADLARLMTAALNDSDIATMDSDEIGALDRLFDAVTWDRREALAERRRALWQAAAITTPDHVDGIEIIDGNAWPDAPVVSAALIRRTDTGQHFIVSTNREETLAWRSDERGNPYPDPDGRGSRESVLFPIGGRGATRADVIRQIAKARPDRLVPGQVDYPEYDN